jgi:predicted HAD superfamily Cof-like phosphohydrolase
MQTQVEDFHAAFEHPIGDTPGFSRPELRAELIREEAAETVDAIAAGDFAAAIDRLCDLLYVTIGAAVEWGIDIEPFFDEVHRANMSKRGGGKREDGKTLKPAGWTPPRIYEEIERQRAARRK